MPPWRGRRESGRWPRHRAGRPAPGGARGGWEWGSPRVWARSPFARGGGAPRVAPANSGGLGQIAKHEFGHALGLGHTNYEGNLMSPAVSPDPQPVPPCVIQGVIEANRWKMVDPQARRPSPPRVSQVPC